MAMTRKLLAAPRSSISMHPYLPSIAFQSRTRTFLSPTVCLLPCCLRSSSFLSPSVVSKNRACYARYPHLAVFMPYPVVLILSGLRYISCTIPGQRRVLYIVYALTATDLKCPVSND